MFFMSKSWLGSSDSKYWHMADADVLPYDCITYGKELEHYLNEAEKKARTAGMLDLDFSEAKDAACKLTKAAQELMHKQERSFGNLSEMNDQLGTVEEDLLNEKGSTRSPTVQAHHLRAG